MGCSDNLLNVRPKSGPEQVFKDFTAFESKKGIKSWKLVAQEALVYEAQKKTQLEDFTVDFYTDNGKEIKATLKAKKGELNTNKNDFYTKGKTVITTPGNEVLESSDLRYKSDTKKIYGDSYVKLTRKEGIVEGNGLEAEPDLSSVIIKESIAQRSQ